MWAAANHRSSDEHMSSLPANQRSSSDSASL